MFPKVVHRPWHSTIKSSNRSAPGMGRVARRGLTCAVENHVTARLFATSNCVNWAAIWASVGSFLVIRANVPDRRCAGEMVDSICRACARLPRFSASILRMGCNAPIFSSPLLIRSATLAVPAGGVRRFVYAPDLVERPAAGRRVVLAPGRRTITAALRILGRDHDPASALSTYPQPRGVVVRAVAAGC